MWLWYFRWYAEPDYTRSVKSRKKKKDKEKEKVGKEEYLRQKWAWNI